MGDKLRQKIIRSTTKLVGDEADGRVAAILSTEDKDRDGDIIRAAGWDLDSFNQHPVLLSSHNYGSLQNQIGEWENVHAEGSKLVGVAKYYIDDGNPEADWGFKLAARGAAAYSVGFIPNYKDAEVLDDDEGEESWWINYDFKTGHELIETSHVTVPSNRQALQEGLKSFGGLHPVERAVGEDVLKRWWEFSTETHTTKGTTTGEAIAEILQRLAELEKQAGEPSSADTTPGISERVAGWND